mmetsp:Transcript_27432/g.63899  ORF Transcript_27432/g.63899 Transcript_27432/m.63899 type:complete len:455 (-) Transcript_27432:550-1914(-)
MDSPKEMTTPKPWLSHPDGKWSPRPQLPRDCRVEYGDTAEIEFCLDISEGALEVEAEPEASREHVRVAPLHPSSVATDLAISISGFPQVPKWTGVKSWQDLQRMHTELEQEIPALQLNPPPFICQQEFFHIPPAMWSYFTKETSLAIEPWLTDILKRGRGSSSLRRFLEEITPDSWSSPAHDVLSLPVASHVLEFLDAPLDMIVGFCLSSKSIADHSWQIRSRKWEALFAAKWPAFYTSLRYEPKAPAWTDWEEMYKQMVLGRIEEVLEVFDREKKVGFSMSCMIAKVSWEQKSQSYVACYVSASHVLPERIPYEASQRLRFCPDSAASQLQPEIAPPTAAEIYPYRVFRGLDGVAVGKGVELQWKMQMGSPFGWWYGVVEHVERNYGEDETAAVTLTFRHFPAHSRWYRLRVLAGDGVMRKCSIGGYHGGIRAVTPEEDKQWQLFFPKEPISF